MSIPRRPSIDRRRFLEIGAAASLTAALGEPARGAAHAMSVRVPQANGVKPHAVIYDERFEAARRLGAALESLRVPAHAFRGDVTQLWYAWLQPLWKRAPAPIAGLTAYAAMFCLERLAWDHRLRMVHRAADAARLAYDPAGAAALIASGIGGGSLAASRAGAAADAFAASSGGPLHSWIIAPAAQLRALTG